MENDKDKDKDGNIIMDKDKDNANKNNTNKNKNIVMDKDRDNTNKDKDKDKNIIMDKDKDSNNKDAEKMPKKNYKKRRSKKKSFVYTWTFKVIIISFFITAFFSLVSEFTASAGGAVVSVLIIFVIIAVGILFDAISTAVTSCDVGPLTAMASRKVKAAKTALKLVNNADKVASFCGDVVGDILSIVGGACIAALAATAAFGFNTEERLLTIIFSSVMAAATIGGKSYIKGISMKKSKEIVMLTANILYFFEKKDKKDKKEKKDKKGGA